MKSKGRFRLATVTLSLLLTFFLASSILKGVGTTRAASSYCQVTYTIANQWTGGFSANITVQNTSVAAWTSWSLAFAFPAKGQSITQTWNGVFTQSGLNVSVTNTSYNGSVAVNGSVSPGLNGVWTSSDPVPTSFTVNGNACNGATATSTPTSATSPTPAVTPTPTSFTPINPSTPLPLTGSHTGNATWFSSSGAPYGGCGVPQANLDSQNFVAVNVQNTPGDYSTFLSRPISSPFASKIGFFSNGQNCDRWVQVTIGNYCTGVNDGAPNQPFCRNGSWVADKYNGATLTMLVADSCQDGNAWCRDDPNHLDLAQGSLNQFVLNGQPVGNMYPNSWNNRQISWQFVPTPNYTGDITLGFLQSANPYWSAISVNHLPNGIHGVQYYQNGIWVSAPLDGDLGQDFIIQPTVAAGPNYQIRVFDANNQAINNGRIYNFSYPAGCGSSCNGAVTPITYTTS